MEITKGFKNFLSFFVKQGRVDKENLEKAFESLKGYLIDVDVPYEVIEKLFEALKNDLKNIPPGFSGVSYLYYLLYEKIKKFLESKKIIKDKGIFLILGLQGSGKTTFTGKLAKYFLKKGKKVLVVSLDYRRPAAFEQLKTYIEKGILEKDIKNIDFLFLGKKENLENILKLINEKKKDYDIILVDTAGRSYVDEDLLKEISFIYEKLKPEESLLVIDSLMGQEALELSKAFKKYIPITGLVLTKADSDTKGASILSAKYILNAPIYFVSEGEKIDTLREFNADIWTQRILEGIDLEKSLNELFKLDPNYLFTLYNKLLEGEYTLYDLKDELILRLSIDPNLISYYINLPIFQLTSKFDEKKIKHWIAIINSMTDKERKNHTLFKNTSRIKRVAKGSGTSEKEVKELLKTYAQLKFQAKRYKALQEKEQKKQQKKMKNMFKMLFRGFK